MKLLAYFLIIVSISFSLSCASGKSAESEEIVIVDDGYKSDSKEEVFIDDRALAGEDGAERSHVATQERTKIAPDGSQTTTMYDGAGNKTETRFFDNNPLLKNIIVRTSVKGEKQVFVFAQNGTVKDLSPDMAAKVLTAPANELATAAGIYEGRKPSETIYSPQTNKPLAPLPGSAFPVRTPQPQTVSPTATEPQDGEPTPTTAPIQPKKNDETPKLNN